MTKSQKRLLLAALLIFLIVIIRTTHLTDYVNVGFFQRYSTKLSELISQNYLLSVLLFMAMMALLIIFFIPLTPLLNIAAGYFFGFFPGTIYALIGSTVGATISFLIFRYLLKDTVSYYFGHRLQQFNREIKQHGAKYLLSLQLLPVTPFGIVIMLASLSAVSTYTFIWTTFVGILPGTLVYVYAGKQLMSIEKVSDIWSWQFIAALMLLTILALLPLIARLIERLKRKG